MPSIKKFLLNVRALLPYFVVNYLRKAIQVESKIVFVLSTLLVTLLYEASVHTALLSSSSKTKRKGVGGRDATGEAGRRLYRLFLITNVLIGASITMLVMLQVPFESAVAAGATAIVGTLIALGASVGRSVLGARQRA